MLNTIRLQSDRNFTFLACGSGAEDVIRDVRIHNALVLLEQRGFMVDSPSYNLSFVRLVDHYLVQSFSDLTTQDIVEIGLSYLRKRDAYEHHLNQHGYAVSYPYADDEIPF